MDNPLLNHFITATIFSLMFSIGINHSYKQLISLWHDAALLVRSLLAVVVVVPLVVGLLLWTFKLPPAVTVGLTLLAVSPGAPMLFKRSQMAGADPVYAASLQLTLALLAVLITPLTLAIFYGLFEYITKRVTPFEVALQVGGVTFLPVIIGLTMQRFAPKIAERLGRPVSVLANILFLFLVIVIVALFIFKPDLRTAINLGGLPYAAIIIIIVVSIACGHLMSEPPQAKRSALAIASIARNIGLALYIANIYDYGQPIVPTLLSFIIVGTVLGIPYSVWSKRQIKEKENQ